MSVGDHGVGAEIISLPLMAMSEGIFFRGEDHQFDCKVQYLFTFFKIVGIMLTIRIRIRLIN